MRLSMQEYCDKQWDQVEEYIKGVQDGSIIACEDVKLGVQRFKEDAKRSDIEVKVDQVDKVFKFFSILNAEYKEEIQQFHLLPWQSFFLAALFGPYWNGTDKRKYTEAFLYMARKNGKTTFAAAIQLYFLLMDGVIFPQSILIAHTKQNANRALESLQGMIMYTPDIAKLLKFNRGQVYIADGKSQGFSETVAAKEASLQGYKLSTCILDEIHTYSDHKLYSAAKKGMSSKINPMLLMISTAGDESKTFCKSRIEYSQKVLRGEIDDDSHFAMLYMLDKEDLKSWNREECWYKANPSLGPVKQLDHMFNELKQAKYFDTNRYEFLTYDLNMYTDSLTKWIKGEFLDAVMKDLNDEDLKGKEVYVGADFSEVKDLTSIALLFPNEEDGTFKAKIYYYFPQNPDNLKRDGSDLNLINWIQKGYISHSTKSIIDEDDVIEFSRQINEEYEVCGYGYDKRAARKIVEGVKEFVSELILKPIQQGWGLSSSIKSIQALIETEKITIDNNPVTRWNFDNTMVKHDDFHNWKFEKTKSLDAIDGVVALTNAYAIYEMMNYGGTGYFDNISVENTGDI